MATRVVDILIKGRDEASGAINSVRGRLGGLASAAFSIKGAIAGALGGLAVGKVLKDSLGAYAEAEAAQERLAASLELLGQDGKAAAADFSKFAAALSANTAVEDDALVNTAALGAALGKLSGDGLKKATAAAVGWSKILQTDVDSAMKLVIKASAGNAAAFARYGVQIDATASKQAAFDQILARGLEGLKLAAAEAKTTGGAMELLKVNVGNLQEEIGAQLAPTVVALADTFRQAMPEITGAVVTGLTATADVAVFLKDVVKGAFTGVVDLLGGLMDAVATASGGFVNHMELMEVALTKFAATAKFTLADAALSVNTFAQSTYEAIEGPLEALGRATVKGFVALEKFGENPDAGLINAWKGSEDQIAKHFKMSDVMGEGPTLFQENIKVLREQMKGLATELFPGGEAERPLTAWADKLKSQFASIKADVGATFGQDLNAILAKLGGPGVGGGLAKSISSIDRGGAGAQQLVAREFRFLSDAPGRDTGEVAREQLGVLEKIAASSEGAEKTLNEMKELNDKVLDRLKETQQIEVLD